MEKFFKSELKDNGGRRSGVDRRYFSYSNHIPERRYGADRRSLSERRTGKDRRDDCNTTFSNMDMRIAANDRRISWKSMMI
ncbi:MAG: hypothetical protein JW927_10085 [Deltaproteobacteria bacterium]|nr:hypothetical protein [Deltaproteobacteria bacterium]